MAEITMNDDNHFQLGKEEQEETIDFYLPIHNRN